MTGNLADGANGKYGAGLFISTSAGTVSITNSILAENLAGGLASDVSGRFVNSGTNNVFGVLAFGASVPNDPTNRVGITNLGLGELMDNGGGIVLTRAILEGSILLNAGTNVGVVQDFDANGNVRIAGGTVDIGAFERYTHEKINGTDGANTLRGGAGFDIIDGKGGFDTAQFSGAWKDYLVTFAAGKYTVRDLRAGSPDGTDTLTNIEQLSFLGATGAIGSMLRVAPTVTSGITPKAAAEGTAFAFNAAVHFNDANIPLGDKLTFSAAGLPSWLSINATTGVLSGTPNFTQASGPITVIVAATDVHNASVATSFTLSVANTNLAPNAIGITASTVAENSPAGTVVGVLFAGDPDVGDAATFTLLDSAGGRFALSGTSVVVANGVLLDAEQAGAHNITVRITDGGGAVFDRTIAIGVTDLNPEVAVGSAGADVLFGGALNDQIFGLGGSDTLVGNAGNDLLDGGTEKDTLLGGLGNDTYIVDRAIDIVSEAARAGTDIVRFTGVARQTFSLGANVENLVLLGGAATNGKGNTLANTLTGNNAANTLDGGTGNDTLVGGRGNDLLIGGRGRDIMTGGVGRDRFDFNAPSDTGRTTASRDIIKDFTHGQDKIDLSTIDANGSGRGNGKFSFIATEGAVFTGVKGQLIYDQVNAPGAKNDKTIILADTNGDGRADFHIELTGLKLLTSGDFVL